MSGQSVFAMDQVAGQRMDELAREMATLKPGDLPAKEIVKEIMRLRQLRKET